jgi:hypothetical protein
MLLCIKKGYGFFHSPFLYTLPKTEIKKAMGAWKPPMALTSNLNIHANAGQTSSMFSQHHQFPCAIFKVFLIWILSSKLNIF